MNYIYKIGFYLTFLVLFAVNISAQTSFWTEEEMPKRETRAVWLTTIGGLDWPRTKAYNAASIEKQKAELCMILDKYQKINVNTVILQTRVRGSVIYPSQYEPWDDCLTGHPGKSPGYDPLRYCIEECHRRGMELHTWLVCIPLGKAAKQKQYGSQGILKRNPKLCKTVGEEAFMIPGAAGTADYIAKIVREIVENYDVDGVSLDYIRYPESSYKFSDEQLCPKGRNKAEWKRENITKIVRAVHDAVKPLKPWVKLSSSPIGKYKDLNRYSSYGWNCYDAVWQDPQMWLRENLQDMLFPMMYFQGNHFYPFVFDWKEHSYGHPVIPGLGIYFLDPREGKWTLNQVRQEMHTLRWSEIGGMAFYRGDFLTRNCKGLYDCCEDEFFPYPSLTQRMTWMGDTLAPERPKSLTFSDDVLRWKGNAHHYNVYGSNVWPVDCSKAENLLAARVQADTLLVTGRAQKVLYYAVTAEDRFGNESSALQGDRQDAVVLRVLNVPYFINRDYAKPKNKKRKK